MLKRGFSAILIGRIDDLYEDVGDLFAWSEEKLVRYAGGDVDDIAGFDCDPGAAFDPAALYLVGRGGLRVDHLAAVHQGGFPALDNHDIGLRLMELRVPILFAMRDRKDVIAEVLLVGDAGGRHAIGPHDYIFRRILTLVRRGCRQGEGEDKE
jgi:hypothetical protein